MKTCILLICMLSIAASCGAMNVQRLEAAFKDTLARKVLLEEQLETETLNIAILRGRIIERREAVIEIDRLMKQINSLNAQIPKLESSKDEPEDAGK